jgi:hypothetical protein
MSAPRETGWSKAFPCKNEAPAGAFFLGTAIAAYPTVRYPPGGHMEKLQQWRRKQEGKLGYILLWALGVPIPVLFVIFLLRGCT